MKIIENKNVVVSTTKIDTDSIKKFFQGESEALKAEADFVMGVTTVEVVEEPIVITKVIEEPIYNMKEIDTMPAFTRRKPRVLNIQTITDPKLERHAPDFIKKRHNDRMKRREEFMNSRKQITVKTEVKEDDILAFMKMIQRKIFSPCR